MKEDTSTATRSHRTGTASFAGGERRVQVRRTQTWVTAKCFTADMEKRSYVCSSSTLMRSDFKNFRSWSLTLNSKLLEEEEVTSVVFSALLSPGLLIPMVASSTRKMS